MAGLSGGIYGGDTRFVPQMLTKAVSAPAVLKDHWLRGTASALEAKDVTKAMILALALNDYALLRKVYEEAEASDGKSALPVPCALDLCGHRPALSDAARAPWMTTGRSTVRTGSVLDASRSDVAALCLQLLVELSQRHVPGASWCSWGSWGRCPCLSIS
eukprot:Skav202468  [mRNA]  locus=scaffold149:489712:492480:+ [translate_table: standard]